MSILILLSGSQDCGDKTKEVGVVLEESDILAGGQHPGTRRSAQ